MGSACCVAARASTPSPKRTGGESLQRNVIHSPSWSFRWDNRVAGEVDNPSSQIYYGTEGGVSMEIKGALVSERGNSSSGKISENLGTSTSPVAPAEIRTNLMTSSSDQSVASNYSTEVKNIAESPDNSSVPNLSFSLPSDLSTEIVDPLSINTQSLPPNIIPSRKACRSPGHQLFRQVSESRILGLKSPSNNSMSEGRPSSVHSSCSNDLTNRSQGRSSDGWSMRTFSELVASSQRGRWSFDSEQLGFLNGKLSESSGRFSSSPSIDLQVCGACSKLLTERSSWSIQKIISSNELSVVAVLDCGHVYHAECLEAMTSDADRHDPACPICMVGEKKVLKMSKKALRAVADSKEKNHKVVLNCLGGGSDPRKSSAHEGKALKLETSSSARSSFSKPFVKRHFSLGSRWSRSLSENDAVRKKGFWARYRKD